MFSAAASHLVFFGPRLTVSQLTHSLAAAAVASLHIGKKKNPDFISRSPSFSLCLSGFPLVDVG